METETTRSAAESEGGEFSLSIWKASERGLCFQTSIQASDCGRHEVVVVLRVDLDGLRAVFSGNYGHRNRATIVVLTNTGFDIEASFQCPFKVRSKSGVSPKWVRPHDQAQRA
jgi:hypothetical protein